MEIDLGLRLRHPVCSRLSASVHSVSNRLGFSSSYRSQQETLLA